MSRYRLRDTTVTAVRWHGDAGKKDAYQEIEETFAINPNSGRIGRMLDNVIGVSDGQGNHVSARPGQWLINGLMDDGMIAMNDDLFKALFKQIEEKGKEA